MDSPALRSVVPPGLGVAAAAAPPLAARSIDVKGPAPPRWRGGARLSAHQYFTGAPPGGGRRWWFLLVGVGGSEDAASQRASVSP